MRHLFVVALGTALLLSGCVVYPLHGYATRRPFGVRGLRPQTRPRSDRDGYGREGWR